MLRRLAVLVLLAALSCRPKTATGRYVYVVTCDARVDKLDTLAERKLESVHLLKVPDPLDGCLTYNVAYDKTSATFSTVAPVQTEPKLLQYSVPALKLVKTQPAAANQIDPPQKPTSLPEYPPNQILETSGDAVLLRMFTANQEELTLAVADQRSKKLVPLHSIPPTIAAGVHLAPGGKYVLIEENSGTKTGQLFLFDAVTGKSIRTLSNPVVKQRYFLAIAPAGKAIYHSATEYSFIDLGTTFDAAPVTHPVLEAGEPAVFFADR